jgi:hypothetical protein
VGDLTVRPGDLVVVIKNKHPSGDQERWFVDNGLGKGFVPSSLLVAVRQQATAVAAQSFRDMAQSARSTGRQCRVGDSEQRTSNGKQKVRAYASVLFHFKYFSYRNYANHCFYCIKPSSVSQN